ncbi:motA/TolQ/ExbB proton channel family protein, partial [Vibrio parahaemolyticus VP2007-007]
RIMC